MIAAEELLAILAMEVESKDAEETSNLKETIKSRQKEDENVVEEEIMLIRKRQGYGNIFDFLRKYWRWLNLRKKRKPTLRNNVGSESYLLLV